MAFLAHQGFLRNLGPMVKLNCSRVIFGMELALMPL